MKTKILFIGILASVCLSACKRSINSEYGPSICPSENYAITSALQTSTNAVDFSTTDSVKITAELNEIVSWTLTITGQTSNAKKTYSGRSSSININWYGDPSSGIFFTQETCNVELSLACQDIVQHTTVDILKISNFKKIGYLPWDFESEVPLQQGPGVSENFSRTLINVEESDIAQSPQGGKYLKLMGNHVDGAGWYYGYTGGDVSGTDLAKLSTDPEKLFVNFYYNMNGKSNTDLFFKVTGGTINSKDGNAIKIKTIPAGWYLVSFPLSDVKVMNVSSIYNFSFSLNTSVQNKAAEANIDFFIITKDKPFGQ